MNIKKALALAFCGMATALNIQAQGFSNSYNQSQSISNRKVVTTNFSDGEIYFGVRIGLAVSHINSDIDALDAKDSKAGLSIGGVVGFPLSRTVPMLFETGLTIAQKGGIGNISIDENIKDNGKFKSNLTYLELPFTFKYMFVASDDFAIQPLVGGYFALGLGGKTKYYDSRTAYGSFSSDRYGLFDAGLRLGCGFSYDMVYAELAYDFGLVNICHDAFDTAHNGVFRISAGINF